MTLITWNLFSGPAAYLYIFKASLTFRHLQIIVTCLAQVCPGGLYTNGQKEEEEEKEEKKEKKRKEETKEEEEKVRRAEVSGVEEEQDGWTCRQ
ncbi:hypothetical protein E2C01_042471 [Portunus trituberculatus]|uniref:Uncharacterized protein n=1 Tax=Portunus trituberculatus TaxID=210409 RepID=A0A5B7FTR7_PORTR|nr:hypothetical protein [Portunus trituberculatus]